MRCITNQKTTKRTGKPLIVTTNLALTDMVECRDGRKRIYDRILELCYPIRFSGQSRRRKELLERSAEMKKEGEEWNR